MKLYLKFGKDGDGYDMVDNISLSPFKNCYELELKEGEIWEMEPDIPDNCKPYQGIFERYSFYSLENKCECNEEDDETVEVEIIETYEKGVLIKTKIKKV